MASPQVKNGYTRIANDLLEKIMSSGLNGTEMSVVLFVIRKTYGFGKKEDAISISQFAKAIPVTRPAICNALKVLKVVKILLLVKKGNSAKRSNLYTFNKNYDEWQLVKKSKLVKKSLHTKERLQKKDSLTENETKPQNIKSNKIKSFISEPAEGGEPESLNDPAGEQKNNTRRDDINKMLEALKSTIGIEAFADSSIERNMARHCIGLIRKIGPKEFRRRLEVIMRDKFHYKNCNRIKYVYNQIKGFIEPKEGDLKGKTVFI